LVQASSDCDGESEGGAATIRWLSGVESPRGSGRPEEMKKVSNTAKWVICAVCAVLGVIGLIYAVIYLAVPIHSLPGFVPGKTATTGHYHKRAFAAAVIGVILLAIAFYVGMTARRSATAPGGSTPEPAVGPAAGGVPSPSAGEEGGTAPS
jgi:hypothetical protein